jgi:hypothetical protein
LDTALARLKRDGDKWHELLQRKQQLASKRPSNS